MKLNDEERRVMVSLEYEKAKSFLEQAEKIAAMDLWDVVANRLYYSIFHAVSALLIKDGHNVSTHKGTLVLFGQHYVKTGIFPADASKLYINVSSTNFNLLKVIELPLKEQNEVLRRAPGEGANGGGAP